MNVRGDRDRDRGGLGADRARPPGRPAIGRPGRLSVGAVTVDGMTTPLARVPVIPGHEPALDGTDLRCRKTDGQVLKSIPSAVRRHPVGRQFAALQEQLARHEKECPGHRGVVVAGRDPDPRPAPRTGVAGSRLADQPAASGGVRRRAGRAVGEGVRGRAGAHTGGGRRAVWAADRVACDAGAPRPAGRSRAVAAASGGAWGHPEGRAVESSGSSSAGGGSRGTG